MSKIKIDLVEKHKISPYLYMQFMEPLGTADASVDAAWDFETDDWYPEVVDIVKRLAPTMIRWGGCFASYYHWKEAIGPQKTRIPMRNHCWGGMYNNHIGTHEVIDFCRRVGAEPLITVNMESEGLKVWQYPKNDTIRLGTADEAAEWVDYCNNPDNALRRAYGINEPYGVKYWQIGNETSYQLLGKQCFTSEENRYTCQRFARKMKAVDPGIKIIGWGDYGKDGDDTWPIRISEVEEVDIVAFHHHPEGGPDSPVYGFNHRNNMEAAWDFLMKAPTEVEDHIKRIKKDIGSKRLAMTEGHYYIPGRNRNEIMSTWAVGVSYAVWHNMLMRHSDVLDIATMADFMGTVWQCNAVMIPAPMRDGKCYLMPVGEVMRLFGAHQGERALDISCNGGIDAVASVTGNKIFIHAANTSSASSDTLTLDFGGKEVKKGKMFFIACDPETEISPVSIGCFKEEEFTFTGNTVTLPRAAVAAIEITLK